MRFLVPIALLVSTTALSGCVTGDGSALSLASQGGVCGVNAGQCATANPVVTATVVTPVTVTPNPTPNTGSTTKLTTGDLTIALEKSTVVSTKNNPVTGTLADPIFSQLTIATGVNGAGPNTAKFEIDTHSPNAALWPVAKNMKEYTPGTCYDLATGITLLGCIQAGGVGGVGLGGTYKEYRAYSSALGQDEELQVWNWKYSYGTQYRDVASGGADAVHQAWSAGGTKTATASVPTSGTANYAGQFGATAKTWNWIDNPNDTIATMSANNVWSVIGKSNLTADFGTGGFSGVLTPEKWETWRSRNGAIGFGIVDVTLPKIPANAVNTANIQPFMTTAIFLNGTIQSDKNTIRGTATLDQANSLGFITDETTNVMNAGIFGPTANEISGVFNVNGTSPQPKGGQFPINDDRRGYIEMSGVFNGQ